jgi:hypothetical protein
MGWTNKYELNQKVRYTEPSGFEWDATITEVDSLHIQITWCRDRHTHKQWMNYNRAYSQRWTRLWSDDKIESTRTVAL